MNIPALYQKLADLVATIGNAFQPLLLLVLRLYWGASFCISGFGKLKNLDGVSQYFASLNIPAPKLNALMAGSTECFGGALLFVGLFSRLISIPLAFTMVVAYATAERDAVKAIFSDPGKFTGAAPFLFLLVALIVLVFGPGKLSLDALLFKSESRKAKVHRSAVLEPAQ